MKPTEAKMVLRRLFGAWRTNADAATAAVYAEALLDLDLDVALEAVAVLIRCENYLPTVARLLEQYRIEHRRMVYRTRALTEPRPRNWQDVQLAGVRRARAVLAEPAIA